ncbi:integrin beta-2 [Bufo gargarizans]|uniref:integrin beta-2 n=1 Tax=Bufo gargarizans TaxID=30331 RepID=UPI001CF51F1A|nr:integrin beta-2 [Bufo gargarizans]XP_044159191.1 integrin beta-2 [Bufo gargarizans]XP_044159193.1 integrin beta-2 [Bufo gargarizans]XP_044159194.1 integrin beta-2 [Bufo gargarizans]
MFWCIVFLLISTEIVTSKFAASVEVCIKIKANTCQECIQSGPQCSWCKKVNFTKAGEADSVRCDTTEKLLNLGCDLRNIIDPKSEVRDKDDQPLDDKVQITPKQVDLQLRPGETGEFEVKFRRAEGYPVDLYYLMDLSYSMLDDLGNVKKLGNQILTALNGITKSAQIGFGSFVDKTVLPFVSTHPEQLRHPCPDKSVPCQSPFSFKHILSLTGDGNKFIEEVGKQLISGNLDSPEGGLDAMMQVAVCGDKIGWRNVTRLLVYATDDGFHIAGDGKLAAILTPNSGLCHLEDNIYKQSNEFDYPSVGQLAQKLSQNNIQVVFAVTSNMVKTYQDLSNLIPKSVVGRLSNDSSNVVQLITEAYQNLSSEVILDHGITPDFLDILYDSHCSNGVNTLNDVRGACSNVKINEEITFKVKVTARKCLPDQSFTIRPLGFTDTVRVIVTTACDCICEDAPDPGACSGNGKTVCGICSCNTGRLGKNCECAAGSKTSQDLEQNCRKDNSTAVCSGAGECICGQCFCHTNDDPARKIFGEYCQCDNWNCASFNGKLCAGQGECNCGVCNCFDGYDGTECQCKKSTDRCTDNGSICSGRGNCICNQCQCNASGYITPFCKTCPGCPSPCPRFGPCVECYIKQEGQNPENCTRICSGARVTPVEQVTEEPFCREKDSDNCWMQYYIYELDGVNNFYIKYNPKRECPEGPNIIAIVGGTVGGVLLIGLLSLFIWKLITYLQDKKEYQRFETERQQAKWNKSENPIFTTATTTVKNPNFDGE